MVKWRRNRRQTTGRWGSVQVSVFHDMLHFILLIGIFRYLGLASMPLIDICGDHRAASWRRRTDMGDLSFDLPTPTISALLVIP